MSSTPSHSHSHSHSHSLSLDQAIRRILEKNFDADSKICLLTLLKIIDNVLQKPGNEKVRSLRTGNATIRSKIIDKEGHFFLMACGFVHFANDPQWQREERLVLLESNEDTPLLVKARHTLARIAVLELGIQSGEIPTYKAPPPPVTTTATNTSTSTSTSTNTTSAAAFDVYAGNRFDGQSASVGTHMGPPENWKSKTEQDLKALQKREAQIQRELANKTARTTKIKQSTTNAATKAVTPTIDRQWTVFLPGQSQSPSSQPALSSAEAMANSTALKLTSSSSTTSNSVSSSRGDSSLLASHFQQQHAKRLASEARGFTTKAMRDLEKLKKAKVYSHTQLAIHFPDGMSIRANFSTREKLHTVLQGLRDDVLFSTETLPLPGFDLYQTPPRRVLEASKSLKDLGLVPAAKVYVSWKTPLVQSAGLQAGWYIQQELFRGGGWNSSSNSSSMPLVAAPGPVLPTSIPVVKSSSGAATTAGAAGNSTAKRKMSKAEKEAAMMKRMLGKR